MKRYLFTSALHSLSAVVSAGMLSCVGAGEAVANPQGGVVGAGAAAIRGQGTSAVQIDQVSDRAVIDWQSFNIAPGESTRFKQPSVSSLILNRIHDQNPSQILGHLSANGQVMLVNPNGMVFGHDARVDVAGLVATSADISDAAFMHGRTLAFDHPGSPGAAIVNQGSISVGEAGLAALVAPTVINDGVITAKAGRVTLGAGDTVTLDLYGDGLVSVAASGKMTGITHAGSIVAPGGSVQLAAADAAQAMDVAVNMTGLIDVSGVETKGGAITLHAGGGTTHVSGTLHADSRAAQGGKIQITGEHIRVGAGAVVTASGSTGGGEIKIGGDYQGGDTLPHAKTAVIEAGAHLNASATGRGDGGRVIVWSDEKTDFAGLIHVTGGLLQGDGGFVETSSKDVLIAHGLVDASAPHGKGGEWLLDPNNITISTAANANVTGSPDFVTTDDSAVVTVNSIQTALNAGTNVSITTGTAGANTQAGNIWVNNAINKTAGGDASLTLKAHENITLNAGITSTSGALDVTLWSDSDNSGSGYIYMNSVAIATNGGDVVMGGGADPLNNPARGNATSDEGITLFNGDISTGAGNISIRGRGEDAGAANYGVYIGDGAVLQTTTGNITITGTGGVGTNDNYGVLVTGAGSAITATVNGLVSVTGTGGGSTTGNYGVWVDAAGAISVVDGTATVTGQGGTTCTNTNYGVYVTGASSAIKATGTGTVTVTGTGGGSTSSNHGVTVASAGAISVVDGTATVQGTGSTTGTGDDIGVLVAGAGSAITATGTGAITVTGTSGGLAAGAGSGNYGMRADSSGAVSAVNGNISIAGTGGSGSGGSHRGIALTSSSAVSSSGSGAITLTGIEGSGGASNDGIYTVTGSNVIGGASDTGGITLVSDSLNLSNFSIQTTGNVTLKPRTASTTIGVGGAAGTLGVTSGILNSIMAGSITVGRSDGTGALIANAYTWNSDVTLLTGATGGITVNGAQAVGAHNLTLQADSDIALNANLSGIGTLTVKPSSVGTTIGLGGGAGTLNLSTADLGYLVDGWSGVTVGRSDGTGAMTVNGATWSDPLTLVTGTGGISINGAQAMGGNAFLARPYGASDITIGASGSITSSAAITLASGRNFINSAGSGALSASSGRWLVYSTNPASDTIGSLSNAFRRFTCAYGGACPAFPAAGNGLLYSYTPTLTATPGLSITYGDAAPNLNGYAYTLSGYLGSDASADAVTGTLVGSTTYAQGNNAGTYNITYGSGTLASDLGYGFSYASSATALTVNKKTLTATADDKSRLYGAANPAFTIGYSGFYGTDTATVLDTAPTGSTAATTASNVGAYAITPAGGLDNNYSFSYVNGTLTVGKAHLSVTADDKGKTYGDANPAFTATLSGFVGGEVLATSGVIGAAALASAATAASHVGTYAITAAQGTLAASNYDFTTFNNGTLTVGKKGLTVTADDKSKTYGDANPALTVSYSGFITGEDATVLDTAPTASTAAIVFKKKFLQSPGLSSLG